MSVWLIGTSTGDELVVDIDRPGPWVAAAQHVENALAESLGRTPGDVVATPAPDRAVHVDPPIFQNARTVVEG